jgi:hypothetical protein
MTTDDKTIKELRRTIEQLEFFRDDYKSKFEKSERELKLYKSSSETIAPPTMHDSMQTRIDMITAQDPDFFEHFQAALKAGELGKNFTVIALKHNLDQGKWEHCEAHSGDAPDLNLLLDRFGPGRYRLVLRYWTDKKTVKGGEIKPAYTSIFRDLHIGNPVDARLLDIETSERLRKTVQTLITLAADLGARYKDISELMDLNISIARKLKN